MIRLFLIYFLLFAGALGALAAEDCSKTYARLEAFISDEFSFGLVPKVTGKATLPSKEEGRESLHLLAELWDHARPDSDFREVVERAFDKGKMKGKRLDELLEDRERLKALRFLCEAICTEQTIPHQLDRLIVRMGRLKDAVKFGDEDEISRTAKKLLKVLSKDYLSGIDKEIKNLEALSRPDLEKRIRRVSRSIRSSLDEKKLEEEEYHEVRKNVGRLQAIVMVNALKSNITAEKKTHDAFREAFEDMGRRHNKLVKAELRGDYAGKIKVKEYERERIEELLEYFE